MKTKHAWKSKTPLLNGKRGFAVSWAEKRLDKLNALGKCNGVMETTPNPDATQTNEPFIRVKSKGMPDRQHNSTRVPLDNDAGGSQKDGRVFNSKSGAVYFGTDDSPQSFHST